MLAGEPEQHVITARDAARRRLASVPNRADDEQPVAVDPAPSADRVLADIRARMWFRVCETYNSAGIFPRVLREWASHTKGTSPFERMSLLILVLLADDVLARQQTPEYQWLSRSPFVYLDELRQGSRSGDLDPPHANPAEQRKKVYHAIPSVPPASPDALIRLVESPWAEGEGGRVGLLRLYRQHYVVVGPGPGQPLMVTQCPTLSTALILWWALAQDYAPPALRPLIQRMIGG